MPRTLDDLVIDAEACGLTVDWRPLGARHGQYEPPARIVINPARPVTVQLCTLAHELAHHALGHAPTHDPVLAARQEALADRYAAELLISPAEYALAERLAGPDPVGIARELGVVSWVVKAYRRALAAA